MIITYTNNNDDMINKFTYQQINYPGVIRKMNNIKYAYLCGGCFLMCLAIYNYFYSRTQVANYSANYKIFIFLSVFMIVFSFCVKPIRLLLIRKNVIKGIKNGTEMEFKQVFIEIDRNYFSWSDSYSNGKIRILPNCKQVAFVENKKYIFVSGYHKLDLVIPKARLSENQIMTLKLCLNGINDGE